MSPDTAADIPTLGWSLTLPARFDSVRSVRVRHRARLRPRTLVIGRDYGSIGRRAWHIRSDEVDGFQILLLLFGPCILVLFPRNGSEGLIAPIPR